MSRRTFLIALSSAFIFLVFSFTRVDYTGHSQTATLPALPFLTVAPERLPTVEMMQPMPKNCALGQRPVKTSNEVGPGVGAYPGFDAPLSSSERSPYGWMQKMVTTMRLDYAGAVVIQGANLTDGTPLWFKLGDLGQTASTSAVLEVTAQNNRINTEGSYHNFPGVIYISKAGCYYIEVNWTGGSWRIVFPAGTVDSAQYATTVSRFFAEETATAVASK